MPMTEWSSVRAEIMRLTRLDDCGNIAYGPKAQLITDGIVSVQYTPEYEDGEEQTLKKANGRFAFREKDDDELKWFNVNIKFTGVNPEAFEIIMRQSIVLDKDGSSVGVRIGETVPSNFGLETWTKIPGQACAGGSRPFGYFLGPWLRGGRLAAFTLENGVADFTIENARTNVPSPWGVGPYDVDLHPAVAAPVLTLGATEAAGGTFTAGTYFWKVSALIGASESVGSNEVTATLIADDSKHLSWAAVSGATGYKVYRGTAAGAENTLVATLGAVLTYEDTGVAGTAGAPLATSAGVSGPLLTPIAADQHLDLHVVYVAPPVVSNGAIALEAP